MKIDPLSRAIESTLLKPEASQNQFIKLCKDARDHHFFGVCVPPFRVPLAVKELEDSPVQIVTVVGFPLGQNTSKIKTKEALDAVSLGAHEIDMVMNIAALKDKDYALVEKDIREVVTAVSPTPVKVIIETSLLTEEEKKIASALVQVSGAQFVKTCTGFAGGGATVDDIRLIKQIVGDRVQIKASGGIRTRAQAEALIQAGASRLGTSQGIEIMKGIEKVVVSQPPAAEAY